MTNERSAAAWAHVLGIFTLFVGPLVMYFLLKRKASPWLRAHLDEAVNYHILVLAAFLFLVVLAVVFTKIGFPTVSLLLALVGLLIVAVSVFFGINAARHAGRGDAYHIPLDIRIIR
jgi:hypothetical protein